MTYERWQSLVGEIKDKFKAVSLSQEALSGGPGSKEVLEFVGPAGRIKLELTIRPRLLGKKTIYSKRIGSATTVDYEYDAKEKVFSLAAFRFVDASGQWQEINGSNFIGNF